MLAMTEMFVNKKIDAKTYEKNYNACKYERNRFKTRETILNKSSLG